MELALGRILRRCRPGGKQVGCKFEKNNMTKPKCPNCEERLSSGEFGFEGIRMCLYCEGSWLTPGELLREMGKAPTPSTRIQWTFSPPLTSQHSHLLCPNCRTHTFQKLVSGEIESFCCSTCHGLFLEKGTITKLAPHLKAPDGMVLAGAGAATGVELFAEIAISIVGSVVTGGLS